MNFEDIVDMDWVDTHTTSEFSSEYYFDHQPDFLLEQPLTPPNNMIEPEIKMEPMTTTMPTTEQIKQLIEIAKRQLALREQQQQQQQQQQPIQQQQVQEQPILFQPMDTIMNPVETIVVAAAAAATAPSSTSTNPFLTPTTVATSEITAIENATTLETISKQMNSVVIPTVVTPAAAADTTGSIVPAVATSGVVNTNTPSSPSQKSTNTITARRDSLASMPDESISLEAYAEADGIDLKRLTPKERRQLRNKLSARNFRVRRKEYISTLEGQVNDHKMAAEALKEKLVKVEEENKKLRKEMDTLKRQNQALQQQQQQQQQQRTSLPKPNLNKDISIMGTKATDSYRQQDNYILVSNAVMPSWDYQAILSQPKRNEYLDYLVGQFLYHVVQYLVPTNRCDDRDYSSSTKPTTTTIKSSSTTTTTTSSSTISIASPSSFPSSTTSHFNLNTSSSSAYIEDLYDVLIQSALINSSTTDKSFWWWDNATTPAM